MDAHYQGKPPDARIHALHRHQAPIARDADASYDIRIDRLAGNLTVVKPVTLKPEPKPAPEPIPEPAPKPEPAPVPTPEPEAAPEPISETNWWLIGGIIVIVAIIAVGVWQYIVRRRSYRV